MMWTLFIILTAILVASGAIFFLWRNFQKTFNEISPREFWKSDAPGVSDAREAENLYQVGNEMAFEMENRKNGLPFPRPEMPEGELNGRKMYQHLLKSVSSEAILFGGLEQGFFMLISPLNLIVLMDKCSVSAVEHSNEIIQNSWEHITESLKTRIAELKVDGIDSEMIAACAHNFFEALFEKFVEGPDPKFFLLKKMFPHVKSIGQLESFQDFYKIGIRTFDPILHTQQINDEVREIIQNGMEGLGEDVSKFLDQAVELDIDVHFPVFTLFRESFKEIKRLDENLTNVSTSLRNIGFKVGLQMAATKAGIIIGGVFGPFGAMAGGILGGWLGKLFAIKTIEKAFRVALGKFLEESKKLDNVFKSLVLAGIQRINDRSRPIIVEFYRETSDVYTVFKEIHDEKHRLHLKLAKAYRSDFIVFQRKISSLRWNPFSWLPLNAKQLDIAERLIESYLKAADDALKTDLPMDALLKLPILVGGEFEKQLLETPARIAELNVGLLDSLAIWMLVITYLYRKAFIQIGEIYKEELKSIYENIKQSKGPYNEAKQRLIEEAQKVGKKIPLKNK